MKKLRIIVDMDCILVEMFEPLFDRIWEDHGIEAYVSDLTQWDMSKCYPLDQMKPKDLYGYFRKPGFFRNLKPLPGALRGVKTLADTGHQIIIVSTPSGGHSAADKYEWLAEHLPWLPEKDVFMGSHKHMVKADVIIDDRGETLQTYRKEWPEALCLGIGYPYNEYLRQIPDSGIVLCGDYQHTENAWEKIVNTIDNFAHAKGI